MHIYTEKEIEKILETTKKYEASETMTPTLYLSLAIFLYIAGIFNLYTSTISENKIYKIGAIIFMSLIVIRNFMIFHDLGHCNFFPSNERKESTIGINTNLCEYLDFMFFFPGKTWRLGHKEHHRVHGNIDEYDQGRTITWTTQDYNNAPKLQKMTYDLLRHPIVFFTIAPMYIFVIQHIIDLDYMYIGKLGLMLFLVYKTAGEETFGLLIISLYIASILGLILFHWQHSINEPYWQEFDIKNDKNSKINADLNGSSVLQIPELFKPFTNGIEYHNVHHVNPGVPSYNIRKCYEELRKEGLLKNKEVDFNEMWESLNYTIYDLKNEKYTSHYDN